MVGTIIQGEAKEVLASLPTGSAGLVIGSPPYAGKGQRYRTKAKWPIQAWVDWMADVTREAVRVANNAVVWVANGYVDGGQYYPACEGLIWTLHNAGIVCERPVIWHKNAPPCKRPWFGNDWEYCMAFRPANSSFHFDWEAIAEIPRFGSGGRFRQRGRTGERRLGGEYPTGKLARPRDVFRIAVGGGHLGSTLAHENEAPYPEKLVKPFIKVLTKAGDLVVDPFSGSGTTIAVAEKLGRRWIGGDMRASQVKLGYRRIAEIRALSNQVGSSPARDVVQRHRLLRHD